MIRLAFALDRDIVPEAGGDVRVEVEFFDENVGGDAIGVIYDGVDDRQAQSWHGPTTGDATWRIFAYDLPNAAFHGRQRDEHEADFTLQVPEGVAIGKVTVTNADELERRTVAYYTIHDPDAGRNPDPRPPPARLDRRHTDHCRPRPGRPPGRLRLGTPTPRHGCSTHPMCPPASTRSTRWNRAAPTTSASATATPLHWPRCALRRCRIPPPTRPRNLVCWLGHHRTSR